MSARDDGGPAFPCVHPEISGFPRGMSLRDYFAAKAMSGICSNSAHQFIVYSADAASRAYAVADAMLAERSA